MTDPSLVYLYKTDGNLVGRTSPVNFQHSMPEQTTESGGP